MKRKTIRIKILLLAAILLIILLHSGCGLIVDRAREDVSPELHEEAEEKIWPEDETEEEIGSGQEMPPQQEQLSESRSSVDDAHLELITDGNCLLALVTKETTLKADYVPPDLRPVPAYMYPSYDMQLRAEALERLEALWQAAAEDGVVLHIRSAYRSYETQKWLFNDYASRHGEEEANRFSARPGQSEHQLGTAVDFGGTAVDFKAAFAETAQGLWLAENAWRFGFAMSYPAGKEHITGYIFEPWHFRYIGINAAAEWELSGLTLIKYLEKQKQYADR